IMLASALAYSAGVTEGRFGQALHAGTTYGEAAAHPIYTVVPITVECWAKLGSKKAFNILLSNESRESGTHWELYTYQDGGAFCANLPGYQPSEIKSGKDITDNQWHYLAMAFDGNVVRLYVDAKKVAEQKVSKYFRYPDTGPLTFGHIDGIPTAWDVYID